MIVRVDGVVVYARGDSAAARISCMISIIIHTLRQQCRWSESMTGGPNLLDWLRELSELQGEAQHLAERFDVGRSTQATYTGSDSSESVQASVDGRGRVLDLALRSGWRGKVCDGVLASAVLAAVQTAQRKRVVVALERFSAQPPWRPDQRAASRSSSAAGMAIPLDAPSPDADPRGEAAQRATHDLLALIEAAEREITGVVSTARERAARQFVGVSGRVGVRLAADGSVLTVKLDERVLRNAQDDYVIRTLRAAFQAAYRKLDGEIRPAGSGSAPDALDALIGDPQLLPRQLLGE